MRILKQRIDKLANVSRAAKFGMAIVFDCLCALLATWLAFTLRYEAFHIPQGASLYVYALTCVLFIPFFVVFNVYSSMVRYSGLRTILEASKAVGAYGLLFFLLLFFLRLPDVPRSVGVLQPILFLGFVTNGRLVASQILQAGARGTRKRRKVLIYGAGMTGIQLAETIFRSPEYRLVGFADDDPSRIDRIINGKRVFPAHKLRELVETQNIREVLLAIPNAELRLRRTIVAELSSLKVRVRSVPSFGELVQGKADVSQLRDLDINDLISREPVAAENITPFIEGQVIMLTGAAGSIGSELCRQIIDLQPREIILVDHSEIGLYDIEQELIGTKTAQNRDIRLHSYLANIRDRARMAQIFSSHPVSTVYHAAAYKHVPIVEGNPIEGVTTNVLGTRILVELAQQFNIRNFIMISTDKAVRPTSVMGASKRLAEQVVQNAAAEAARNGGPVYAMVRFGNVLDSSGSVVPLFRRQIAAGGPVTVTHADVTRYFMTIPEAVTLVLQAGAMAKGGEVFLLDMGQPVRIIDLARKMIGLSGLSEKTPDNPEGDIEVVTIGLRPGEKLTEELLIGTDSESTNHPYIMMAHEEFLAGTQLMSQLDAIEKAASRQDVEAVLGILRATVAGYGQAQSPVTAA